VPGHGPVCRGAEVTGLLDELEQYAWWVAAIAAAGVAEGIHPLRIAERHRENAYSHWQEPERLVGNLHRAFSELAGNPVETRLRVPDVWPDMVAFHGGPIGCRA
jgi:cyclase